MHLKCNLYAYTSISQSINYCCYCSCVVRFRPLPELAGIVLHARQSDGNLRGIRTPRGPGHRGILQRRALLGVHGGPVRRGHRPQFWSGKAGRVQRRNARYE